MKKRLKSKNPSVLPQADTDIAGLILKVQQQLSFLDKKMDTLIGRIPERSFERTDQPKPFQRFNQIPRRDEDRQSNNYNERVLHKAICAECKKECEVPFRPSGDRPVYCKECFSKRKAAGGPFKTNIHDRPRREDFIRERHPHKYASGENRKSYEKKPVSKRRKRSS